MAHLTADEREHYAHQGYVVPGWRLPQARVEAMRSALDRLIADNPGVRPEKLVSAHIEGGGKTEGVRGNRAFLELAMDPELVELIADAIGGDVILWGCQVFCKPGGDGYETGHWNLPVAYCMANTPRQKGNATRKEKGAR